MSPKIIPIHDGKPPLTDIPGRLRTMANQIEAGEYGDVASMFVIIR